MKQPKTRKLSKNKLRIAQALQVREYIERHRPDLRDSEVEISACGNFASVRKAPESEPNDKKPNE